PRLTKDERLAALEKHPLIDKAILGDTDGYIAHIAHENPDIIALGYDQGGEYVEHLERDLKSAGLMTHIVRLKPFQPEIFKTSKLKPN
ncbi:MAG: hypothetical protein AAB734_03095, partial [Patescibacteria group bacterium]